MHRAAVAVEQAGPGEQVAAGGECAEAATAAALAAQGGDHRRIAQALDCEAGNHDQEVEAPAVVEPRLGEQRSEEHTSELQSLMRISYAVFCLKKKKRQKGTLVWRKRTTDASKSRKKNERI